MTRQEYRQQYKRTPQGFLLELYHNMSRRVRGIRSKKHLYMGKSLLPKEIFLQWGLKSPNFAQLFNNYIMNDCPVRLAPSVDRVNPDKGYILTNMEWVTHSENCRRSSMTRRRLK